MARRCSLRFGKGLVTVMGTVDTHDNALLHVAPNIGFLGERAIGEHAGVQQAGPVHRVPGDALFIFENPESLDVLVDVLLHSRGKAFPNAAPYRTRTVGEWAGLSESPEEGGG